VYNHSQFYKDQEKLLSFLNGNVQKNGQKIEGLKDYSERVFSNDDYKLKIQFEIMTGPSCNYKLYNEFQLILRDVEGLQNENGSLTYSGGAAYTGQTQVNNLF